MNRKDLFKNIIEQNIPSKDETLSVILTKTQMKTENAKTKRGINFKQIVKYTLPAAMVLTIVFVSIFAPMTLKTPDSNIIADTDGNSNAISETAKGGNWFSIFAYAADDASQYDYNIAGNKIELQQNVAITLPHGLSSITTSYFRDGSVWDSNLQPFKLTIEGDNIKSVRIKDENSGIGLTESNLYIAKINQDILPWEEVIIGDIRGGSYTNLEKLKEYWGSGILDDIKEQFFQNIGNKFDYYYWMGMQSDEDKENGEWQLYAIYGYDNGRLAELPPEKSIVLFNEDMNQRIFTCSIMRWFSFGKVTMDETFAQKHELGESIINRETYSNDRITVTVTFNDGEKLTQTIELTISEETCETFLKIIE